MTGIVAGLFRHPVKGFTPEAVTAAQLGVGERFPHDRIWAVENGPSGYDPAAPAFVPKQKFTVLMSIPRVAQARTRYEAQSGWLTAEAPGRPGFSGRLSEADGREAFAHWLGGLLGDEARGPLRVVEAADGHRFTDHPLGHVSIINLASVRDLESRMGVAIDPLRFRANVYVDGWPPWVENDCEGRALMLGWAEAKVFKPIVRCAATHVNPDTAERDIDIVKGLYDAYGHMNCGVYVHVTRAGQIGLGDACTAPRQEGAE